MGMVILDLVFPPAPYPEDRAVIMVVRTILTMPTRIRIPIRNSSIRIILSIRRSSTIRARLA